MAKTPINPAKKRTPHSTRKPSKKNKPVGDGLPIGGCDVAMLSMEDLAAALAGYLFNQAGMETGEQGGLYLTGAGEFGVRPATGEGRYWKDGPNGIGWYGS